MTQSASLKRTPLYDTHVASGAKMVDFGGWEMPIAYGSQLEEHHAVRRHAGMFDVSHMRVVDLDGHDTRGFLRTLIANDVAKLTPHKALYGCMLNETGGVIDDLIVYWMGGEHYRAVVNASTADKDIAWMHDVQHGKAGPGRHFAVSILPRRDLAMIAVQGPQARAIVRNVIEGLDGDAAAAMDSLKPFTAAATDEFFIARTGYTGEDGCEVVLPAPEAPDLWSRLKADGVRECGLGARDTLRLEAGMALYGNDMDESVSPLDAGLAWTVDMKSDRAFIGRAALERIGQTREFVGLKLLDKGVLRAHQRVITAHGEGEITSGTFSPTLGFAIAMARLPPGVAVGDTVQVDVRGKTMAALVVKMPFVRNGKAMA
jgi:aminomethyltransferase